MSTSTTWGMGARRKALALLAASALLASMIVVFSPAAWGNPPSVECASTDPEWDDDYWKIQIDSGTLSTVESNVAGAISLDADGSWTNDNDDDEVFRIVLKVGTGVETQVLSGMWETGEGGTIDLTLDGLGHVTFCFTDEDDDEEDEEDDEDEDSEEPGPTTTTTTTTASASPTTTASASSPTTTSAGPTTTTSPDTLTTTTPASDESTTNAAANSTGVSDPSQPDESAEADGSETDGSAWYGPEGSLPDTDRDTTVAGLIGDWGDPPALGQGSVSSDAVPGVIPSSHQWPTQVDLAILGALIAAIAALAHRRKLDFRRLLGKTQVGKRS